MLTNLFIQIVKYGPVFYLLFATQVIYNAVDLWEYEYDYATVESWIYFPTGMTALSWTTCWLGIILFWTLVAFDIFFWRRNRNLRKANLDA